MKKILFTALKVIIGIWAVQLALASLGRLLPDAVWQGFCLLLWRLTQGLTAVLFAVTMCVVAVCAMLRYTRCPICRRRYVRFFFQNKTFVCPCGCHIYDDDFH